jgi:hypothetical protein
MHSQINLAPLQFNFTPATLAQRKIAFCSLTLTQMQTVGMRVDFNHSTLLRMHVN